MECASVSVKVDRLRGKFPVWLLEYYIKLRPGAGYNGIDFRRYDHLDKGGAMKFRMRVFSVTVFVAAGLLWSGVAMQAYGDIGNIIFKDTKSFAPVVFSHKSHKSAGAGCADCHDILFKKQQGSTDRGNALTMKALRAKEYCGSCHDGKQAFSASKNCKQCHRK